jgi:phosphocarrier protein
MDAVLPSATFEARHNEAAENMMRRSFVLNLKNGLHARPCAMLVKALQPYRVTVEVEANGEKASGKSILGLMALGVSRGGDVSFTIVGVDAFEAMAEVDKIFSSNFAAACSSSTKRGGKVA